MIGLIVAIILLPRTQLTEHDRTLEYARRKWAGK